MYTYIYINYQFGKIELDNEYIVIQYTNTASYDQEGIVQRVFSKVGNAVEIILRIH